MRLKIYYSNISMITNKIFRIFLHNLFVIYQHDHDHPMNVFFYQIINQMRLTCDDQIKSGGHEFKFKSFKA